MKTSEIASIVGGKLHGDGDIEIVGLASIKRAKSGDIAFLDKIGEPPATSASCVLVPSGLDITGYPVTIETDDPKLAFALIAAKLKTPSDRTGVDRSAVIHPTAKIFADYIGSFVSIGADCQVGANAHILDGTKIGTNVLIGDRTVVHPNCVIYDGVSIGSDCVIHSGTVIGADGFGYVRDRNGTYHQFPQIGSVVIENNVEIGANCCIDRGSLGVTTIGEGSKIDNLVQIAHNVSIGKHVIIAAQTGISGSTVIEDHCVIGGQVGMGDHARVLSGAVIGSQAGVLPGKIVRPGVWWGTPVQPLDEYKRQNAMVKGIGRLRDEVKELKKRLL